MQKDKIYKQKVSISLDGDLIESIKILAENEDRNFSQYINLILKKHVNEKKKSHDL